MMQLLNDTKKLAEKPIKSVPLRIHTATSKQMVYTSLLIRGRGQIFDMGRLSVPVGVLIVTTRTRLSLPGWVSRITEVGQCRGDTWSSLSRTRSPGWKLWDVFSHRWRCCRP
jgi:hypothetical protein